MHPDGRIKDMRKRLKDDFNHWCHWVVPEDEKDAKRMLAYDGGFTRREMTFTEVVANRTYENTYAYVHARNRYTVADRDAIDSNAARSSGSRGYDRRGDDDNKRRRR